MAKVRIGNSGTENVRMGPLALFTLMAVICLAVLAVLALSTSNATVALAERRAEATTQLYLDEAAAQVFVAELDGQVAAAGASEDGSTRDLQAAVAQATTAALDSVTADPQTQLNIRTNVDGDTVNASFDCGNGRQLDITITWEPDGTLSVQRWRMTTVVNEEPAMGNLLGSS